MKQEIKRFRALLWVFDDRGVADFAKALSAFGFEILSLGQTFHQLAGQGLPVTEVTEAGLDHILRWLRVAANLNFCPVDGPDSQSDLLPVNLVCLNTVPLDRLVADSDMELWECVAQAETQALDLINAAAHSYAGVTLLVDPHDYQQVLDDLDSFQGVHLKTRQDLAGKACQYLAAYFACAHHLFQPKSQPPVIAGIETMAAVA